MNCLYYILGILTRGQPSVLTLNSREFGMYYWFRSYIITSPDIYAFILLYMYMLLSWKMCFYLVIHALSCYVCFYLEKMCFYLVIYAFILLCMLLSWKMCFYLVIYAFILKNLLLACYIMLLSLYMLLSLHMLLSCYCIFSQFVYELKRCRAVFFCKLGINQDALIHGFDTDR